MFESTVYVKIYCDRFWARHLESGTTLEAVPPTPTATPRLLIGYFNVAETTLAGLVKQVARRGWLSPAPALLVQPMEKIEGGLSQVEQRVLLELAAGAGARAVKIHLGAELSDAEVKTKLGRG